MVVQSYATDWAYDFPDFALYAAFLDFAVLAGVGITHGS
jgi:hypothetical protein